VLSWRLYVAAVTGAGEGLSRIDAANSAAANTGRMGRRADDVAFTDGARARCAAVVVRTPDHVGDGLA
jgi:hypothetical protein